MDDEELIRDVAIKMLRYIGYEAELASDGDEAIALYVKARESGAPFDAVIMDLTVPVGLGGREAIQKLYELDPNVKGLVSSGYSSDPVTTEFSQYGFRGFVAKPYRIQELADALDQIIKGP
jgi:CheY-like chemotaxis protein